MERDEVKTALAMALREASKHVVAVYLFGSLARGDDGQKSDVDLALLLRETLRGTLDNLNLDLEGELERFVRRPVQVVVLNTAPVDLIHRVLRDGLIVLDRDRSFRLAFEVRARSEYLDIKPVLLKYRQPRGSCA